MTLFIVSIPFVIAAVAVAVIPLVAMSRKELRHIAREFEQYRARHRHGHQGHRQDVHDAHHGDRTPVRIPVREAERHRWHEPVLIHGN